MADSGGKNFRDESILEGLAPDLREALLARGNRVTVTQGQSLFMEGDDANGFFVVRSGALKATRFSSEGDEQLIALFSTDDTIGEMAMFDEAPRSATITALRPSTLLHWSTATFFGFADENSALYRHLLSTMALRLRETNDALAARHFLPLSGQLARVILRLVDGFGTVEKDGSIRIAHKLTQTELASMIGASRENVSRVLNSWKRDAILARESGHYRLIDRETLETLSAG